MYIKKVTKTNGRSKKKYDYLHLVESVRTEDGPRQRLVLNLGKLDIDPSLYKSLARRIEDILTGQKSLLNLPLELEKMARSKASRIFDKRAKEVKETTTTNFRTIDLNSIEASESRSFGGEYLCNSIWNELDMNKFLKRMDIPENIIPILESLVIGRLVDPGSERHTKEWVENRSSLYELTGNPLRPSLSSYYRGGDYLFGIKNEIEKYLAEKEKSLFSLDESLFFFDLTNSYFEGEARGNPKAQYGRSKEKRSDCKLVTMGMIIDELGFAKYSKMFPGNQSEAATLSDMVKAMEANLSGNTDKTIVMDAGIATEDNIKWLKENEYHYIVVNRGSTPFEKDFSNMKTIRQNKNGEIDIQIKRYDIEEEAYILCKSRKKTIKEQSMRTRVEDLFNKRMEHIKNGLNKKRGTKKYQKVLEMIGRLKEKYPAAAKLYEVEVIPEEGKKSTDLTLLAVEVKWEKKKLKHEEERKTEGSYVLRTDRIDLTDEKIWEIYIMLGNIEYSWLTMKSYLGLRPNFHQKEDRVDTHMFISVLAYHILHIIEYRLRMNNDHRKWVTIRNVLSTHRRLTLSFGEKTEDGKIGQRVIRTCTKPETEHMKIYNIFGLKGSISRVSSVT
ncbi:MAG: IS1634 family transposase [Spirochaetales bacterium]|nr:IS1634 family transposase [Spirochaetales bacterium]